MAEMVVIELWPHTDFCCVCGEEVLMEYGLPMYESEILPADWKGEWGGFTACRRCFELFNAIKAPMAWAEARKITEEAKRQ